MLRVLMALLLSTLITSCATMAPTTKPAAQIPWKTRVALLSRLQNWQLHGKIAVITANESGSATVDWIHHPQTFSIALFGPLGANSLKLSGEPGRVTMETADGKHATAKTAEQLLVQQWKWRVPISNLNYWILGLPVPGIPFNAEYDAYNRLSSLVQAGWNVNYMSYTSAGSVDLPNRMAISSPILKTKLVIYEWKTS